MPLDVCDGELMDLITASKGQLNKEWVPFSTRIVHAKFVFKGGEMTGPLAHSIATGDQDWTEIISTGEKDDIYHDEIPERCAEAKTVLRDHFGIPLSVRISLKVEGHVYADDSRLPNPCSSAIHVELTRFCSSWDTVWGACLRRILTFDNFVGEPVQMYYNIAQVFRLTEDVAHTLLQATLPQLVRNPPLFLRCLGFCPHGLMCFNPIASTIPRGEAFRNLVVNAVACYCSPRELRLYQKAMHSPLARSFQNYDHFARLSKLDCMYRKDCIQLVAHLDARRAAGAESHFRTLEECVELTSKVHNAAWVLCYANELQLRSDNPWKLELSRYIDYLSDRNDVVGIDFTPYMSTLERVFETEQFRQIESIRDHWRQYSGHINKMTLTTTPFAVLANYHPKKLLAFKDHSIIFDVHIHSSKINYTIDQAGCMPLMLQGSVNVENIMACKACAPPGYQLCTACKDWHHIEDFFEKLPNNKQVKSCIHCIVANPRLTNGNCKKAESKMQELIDARRQSTCSGRTVDRKKKNPVE